MSSALLAPGREPFTLADLELQNLRFAAMLRDAGIGPRDRVAVVLPNGPVMAAAFLGISRAAACAPLNPLYTQNDFEFYLEDSSAKALVVSADSPGLAADAARKLTIPVLALRELSRAGEIELATNTAISNIEWPRPEDTALLLHTSGTTSRPKLVPLSGANLVASARHIAATLALTPEDRCLNIMPLFHIHGLVAALMASLHANASIVCTDGVYSANFFRWLEDFQPTWYTAVPTMHQAILARARELGAPARSAPLRFIRSSSAALPPSVMVGLEEAFGVPVLEAYGMTEASHQMCSNPLPPRARKPGSVGLAAGPDVAIMDDTGRLLEADSIGEVVIRGPNVTAGYLANEEANRTAFTNGWFLSLIHI